MIMLLINQEVDKTSQNCDFKKHHHYSRFVLGYHNKQPRKMTWTDTITKNEKETIETLKRLTIKDCTPKMLEDETLFYRFLKARDFNLKDAEEMLRNHINWRKEYQIDTIIKDYKASEVNKI
ncbi:hypothetical protein JTE90_022754 [Oedothorax gibbosus]|uniref:CRAL/TRIO N-terminal domain-containing protein n=1 Tax=Oedothorax gibbosus TaxID=931172 RepID=A0AAV6U832_9ARAC|nr:hypothetical protein JTE90_022754 [Oedothorax gibbosus]